MDKLSELHQVGESRGSTCSTPGASVRGYPYASQTSRTAQSVSIKKNRKTWVSGN